MQVMSRAHKRSKKTRILHQSMRMALHELESIGTTGLDAIKKNGMELNCIWTFVSSSCDICE